MTNYAIPRRTKTVSETVNVAVDFSGMLEDGETITGTPTVTERTTSDLTIDGIGATTTTMEINGRDVDGGQAVVFRVSGGQANTQYEIDVQASTDKNQVRRATLRMTVTPD